MYLNDLFNFRPDATLTELEKTGLRQIQKLIRAGKGKGRYWQLISYVKLLSEF